MVELNVQYLAFGNFRKGTSTHRCLSIDTSPRPMDGGPALKVDLFKFYRRENKSFMWYFNLERRGRLFSRTLFYVMRWKFCDAVTINCCFCILGKIFCFKINSIVTSSFKSLSLLGITWFILLVLGLNQTGLLLLIQVGNFHPTPG